MAPADPWCGQDDDTDYDYYDTPFGKIWRPGIAPGAVTAQPALTVNAGPGRRLAGLGYGAAALSAVRSGTGRGAARLPARRTSAGIDIVWGMYQWHDRAPRGHNETGPWPRRHDEYHNQ